MLKKKQTNTTYVCCQIGVGCQMQIDTGTEAAKIACQSDPSFEGHTTMSCRHISDVQDTTIKSTKWAKWTVERKARGQTNTPHRRIVCSIFSDFSELCLWCRQIRDRYQGWRRTSHERCACTGDWHRHGGFTQHPLTLNYDMHIRDRGDGRWWP